MYSFLKIMIKKIVNLFGFEVNKFYPELHQMSFDQIYKKILKDNILVIDVGANKGQTIERFRKLFLNKNIHSFEPIKHEYLNLKQKYSNKNNIVLNNFAMGELPGEKEFNINHYTGSSSFLNIKESNWLNFKSKKFNIEPKNFLKNKEKIKIETLDNYCQKNNIKNIDIVKIDTQGYEDKVLEGCQQMIEGKNIKFIELEIILSDLYENTLSIKDIEDKLKNNYRLFANDYYGNLYSNMVYQLNLIYINKDYYLKIKKDVEITQKS